jgi:hypothetical protein
MGQCDWAIAQVALFLYTSTYIYAVEDSVILYLQHDFYNIIFKIKLIIHVHSLRVNPTPPHPQGKFWVRTWILLT